MQPTAIAEQTAEEGQQDREHDRHNQADDQHRVVDSKFRQNEVIIWIFSQYANMIWSKCRILKYVLIDFIDFQGFLFLLTRTEIHYYPYNIPDLASRTFRTQFPWFRLSNFLE